MFPPSPWQKSVSSPRVARADEGTVESLAVVGVDLELANREANLLRTANDPPFGEKREEGAEDRPHHVLVPIAILSGRIPLSAEELRRKFAGSSQRTAVLGTTSRVVGGPSPTRTRGLVDLVCTRVCFKTTNVLCREPAAKGEAS